LRGRKTPALSLSLSTTLFCARLRYSAVHKTGLAHASAQRPKPHASAPETPHMAADFDGRLP